MSFLNTAYLVAAISIAIPIILHFIQFQKARRISFSTLAFFQDIVESTIKRIHLLKLLLLALRIFGILLLVLALAGLYTGSSSGVSSSTGATDYVIIIDNSPSTSSVGELGQVLHQEIKFTKSFIESAESGSRFMVIPSNGKWINRAFVNASQAINSLNSIQVSSSRWMLADYFDRLEEKFNRGELANAQIFWLTDAQFHELNELANIQQFDTKWVQELGLNPIVFDVKNEIDNIYIESVTLQNKMIAAGQAVFLSVDVQKPDDFANENSFLNFIVNGENSGQYNLDPELTNESLSFSFIPEDPGFVELSFEIEGDQHSIDNRYFTAIQVPDKHKIAIVKDIQNNENPILYKGGIADVLDAAKVLNESTPYQILALNNIENHSLADYDVVVLNENQSIPEYLFPILLEYVQNGGGLWVIPATDVNTEAYNRMLNLFDIGQIVGIQGSLGQFQSVSRIDNPSLEHPVFSDLFETDGEISEAKIDQPSIYYMYNLKALNDAYSILKTTENQAVILERKLGAGTVWVSALGVSPEWSNLPIKAIFAPFMYRSLVYLGNNTSELIHTADLDRAFEYRINTSSDITEINFAIGDSVQIKPRIRSTISSAVLSTEEPVLATGFIDVKLENELIGKSALNQVVAESDLSYAKADDWATIFNKAEWTKNINQVGVQNMQNNEAGMHLFAVKKEWWPWLIGLAIIVFMIESFFANRQQI